MSPGARERDHQRDRDREGGEVPVQVLVVEDDPVAADAHTRYVARVPGFAGRGGHALPRRRFPLGDAVKT